VPTVVFIRVPKHPAKVRFFVPDDEQVEARTHCDTVSNKDRTLMQDDPTDNHRQDAKVHRIARVPIQSTHDESLGRVNRERRSRSKGCEIPNAPRVCRTSYSEESHADHLHGTGGARVTSRQEPWCIRRNRPRHDDGEKHVLDEKSCSTKCPCKVQAMRSLSSGFLVAQAESSVSKGRRYRFAASNAANISPASRHP